MCGRFVRKSGELEICQEFDMDPGDIRFLLEPCFNIAPGTDVAAVIKRDRDFVEGLRWGLVPSWSMDEKAGYKMINARAETLSERPSFKKPFQSQRCLIIADGFFEWSGNGKIKRPYYFHLKRGTPMGLAGLFESWAGTGAGTLNTCSIITTSANSLMLPVHHRMPAIIRRDDYREWLDNGSFEERRLKAMLQPFEASEMACYPVGPLVNSIRSNSEKCIEPAVG